MAKPQLIRYQQDPWYTHKSLVLNLLSINNSYCARRPRFEGNPNKEKAVFTKTMIQLIAVYSYESADPTHLRFPKHAVITAKPGQFGNSLWFGSHEGRSGWFPPSYCRLQVFNGRSNAANSSPVTRSKRRSASYDFERPPSLVLVDNPRSRSLDSEAWDAIRELPRSDTRLAVPSNCSPLEPSQQAHAVHSCQSPNKINTKEENADGRISSPSRKRVVWFGRKSTEEKELKWRLQLPFRRSHTKKAMTADNDASDSSSPPPVESIYVPQIESEPGQPALVHAESSPSDEDDDNPEDPIEVWAAAYRSRVALGV